MSSTVVTSIDRIASSLLSLPSARHQQRGAKQQIALRVFPDRRLAVVSKTTGSLCT